MAEYLKKAKQKPEEDIRAVQDTVREILDRVKKEGEAAVRDFSKRFDDWSPKSFRISQDEIRAARAKLPKTEIEDIDFCQAQIRNFAAEQMKRLVDFEVETLPGVHLGQKVIPVASSGSYVPGGRYPMPSLRPHDRHHAEGGRGRPGRRLLAPRKRRRFLAGHALLDGCRRGG